MTTIIDLIPEKFIANSKELDKKFIEACEWLTTFGIDYKKTRFGLYEKDFKDFVEGKGEKTAKESLETFMNANLEATELVRLKTTFESFDNTQLSESIKKLVAGQRFRNSSDKDQSRDFAFELSIGSRFSKAGYAVNLRTISDLVVIIGNRKLYVECKRLKSYNQLEKRVKSANEQIKKRLRSEVSSKARGMVALNITDIINPTASPVIANDIKDYQKQSSDNIKNFVLAHQEALSKNKHNKSLGVFTEFATLGFINSNEKKDCAFAYIREGNMFQYPLKDTDIEFLNEFWPSLGNQHVF
jgi:hypothetical protein